MLPYSFIGGGYYTSDTTAKDVALSARPDFFQVEDFTNWGAANTAVAQMRSWWRNGMANGSYLQLGQISAAAASNYTYGAQGTSGGFTFVDQSNPPTFSAVVGTTINNTTFVCLTGTTTGLAVGDYVRITNSTGMLQLGGMTGQITAVNPGVSFTLGYLATAVSAGLSIAANATAFYYRKFYPTKFYPLEKRIAYITQATQAKVYFSSKHDFTPGEFVDFNVPPAYGMYQISYLTSQSRGPARVLSVVNTASESSITIDLDTSGYSAFVWPTSANFVLSSNGSPAVCLPAGSGIVPLNGSATIPQSPPGTNLVDAFDNRAQYVMNIGTNVCGANNAVMYWQAWKADYYNAITNA